MLYLSLSYTSFEESSISNTQHLSILNKRMVALFFRFVFKAHCFEIWRGDLMFRWQNCEAILSAMVWVRFARMLWTGPLWPNATPVICRERMPKPAASQNSKTNPFHNGSIRSRFRVCARKPSRCSNNFSRGRSVRIPGWPGRIPQISLWWPLRFGVDRAILLLRKGPPHDRRSLVASG